LGSSAKGSGTRPICTHGKWAIAFTAVKQAILFAYPQFSAELESYEQFIIGQFATIQDPAHHSHILNLDCAI
jgi:hypothetical protein